MAEKIISTRLLKPIFVSTLGFDSSFNVSASFCINIVDILNIIHSLSRLNRMFPLNLINIIYACIRKTTKRNSWTSLSGFAKLIDSADKRIRTSDLRLTKALLYQLSYVGKKNRTDTSERQYLPLNNSGSQTRTDDNLINSQVLYRLSYAGIIKRGSALSSQGAIPQLLLAHWSLTAVFGMGTGVSFRPSPPHFVR